MGIINSFKGNIASNLYLGSFFSAFYLILGTHHLRLKSSLGLKLWYVAIFIFDFLLIILLFLAAKSVLPNQYLLGLFSFVLGLCLGITSDALFIIITRNILRWCSGFESFKKIFGLILANLILAFAFSVLPLLSLRWFKPRSISFRSFNGANLLAGILIHDACSNLPIALSACAFIFLSVTLLLHRVFWPVLDRPLYALQHLGIARRSKLFGALGLILAGVGIGILPSAIKELVEKLLP